LPGCQENSDIRYAHSGEVIQIMKQAWTQERINFQGQFYQLQLDSAPVKPYQHNGGPLLYFGGYSAAGVALCAQYCDEYLMWPETGIRLAELMNTMSLEAGKHNRTVIYYLLV